jgi:4-amino-4-deoxy-L-arabinose transferase-like glycosyltransferase
MGTSDAVPLAAAVADRNATARSPRTRLGNCARLGDLVVVLIAAAVFFGSIASPPSLMDDVDAVQAQIARNMLDSGDWVTARLDGVPYLEKAPLHYWVIAVSYMLFGVSDWAARIPFALAAVLLCWVTYRFGRWAFGHPAGAYAGIALSTSVGLFLFTRILIPDAMLTLTVTLALWSLLRALDEQEPHPRRWAAALAVCLALGVLLKGLIAAVFVAGVGGIWLAATRQLLAPRTWRRLHPVSGLLLFLAIAAPWHVLAILRNPPYFDFTLRSEPGVYRGFFWFYFLNEHVFRFLNMRYPRDYNTVPRLLFWSLHLIWLFPWSPLLAAAARLSFRPADRAGATRLLALIWAAFVLVFFTFSTTQEYYSMPCYPALALLIGSAAAAGGVRVRRAFQVTAVAAALAAAATGTLLWLVRDVPAPGDISQALRQNPELYTLSLGHMGDLTVRSFAYLKLPLAMACAAFLIGAAGIWLSRRTATAAASAALMMVLFLHAARVAMIRFDPYLSSRPLAEALKAAPPGRLIVDDQYYAFSSVFFYANTTALLLNGRVMNLEYGSYAPGAPNVFIHDDDFQRLWRSGRRYYLVAADTARPRLERLVGPAALRVVAAAGGKALYVND